MTKQQEYEKLVITFFIKGTLSDFSKILIFFFIFYLMKLQREFCWSLFFLILFRTFSGGIHCKSYLSCLLLSFAILSSEIFLGISFYLPKTISLFIYILCSIITCYITPVISTSRPPLTTNVRKKAKLKEATILIIFFILLMLYPSCRFYNIGFWSLILHTIQLFIAYTRR